MSKLSKRRPKTGPLTSTQVDGDEVSNDNEEYLSREERVFKRQLEMAIERSKISSAQDQVEATSGSEVSEQSQSQEDKQTEPSTSSRESMVDRKRRAEEVIESPGPAAKASKKARLRKLVIDSDEDNSDDDFNVANDDSDEEFTATSSAKPKKSAKKVAHVKKNEKADTKANEKKTKEITVGGNAGASERLKVNHSNVKAIPDSTIEIEDDAVAKTLAHKENDTPKRKARKLIIEDDEDDEFNDAEFKKMVRNDERPSRKASKVAEKKEVIKTTPKSTPREKPTLVDSSPTLGGPKPKVTVNMPKWTPPARASKDSPLSNLNRSNLSPGFRVGLSRNVKVKPLHPNVKMTPN